MQMRSCFQTLRSHKTSVFRIPAEMSSSPQPTTANISVSVPIDRSTPTCRAHPYHHRQVVVVASVDYALRTASTRGPFRSLNRVPAQAALCRTGLGALRTTAAASVVFSSSSTTAATRISIPATATSLSDTRAVSSFTDVAVAVMSSSLFTTRVSRLSTAVAVAVTPVMASSTVASRSVRRLADATMVPSADVTRVNNPATAVAFASTSVVVSLTVDSRVSILLAADMIDPSVSSTLASSALMAVERPDTSMPATAVSSVVSRVARIGSFPR